MDKLRTYNHGTGLIQTDMKGIVKLTQGMPTELHLKEDGTLDNKPSFAVVIEDLNRNKVIGQISLRMLKQALNELGYDVVKLGD